MAKQKTMLPARKLRDRSRDDDSLLLRSAESLGRVIGALQRQLDAATKRLSVTTDAVTQGPSPRADDNSRDGGQTGPKRQASRTRATASHPRKAKGGSGKTTRKKTA